MFIEKTAPMHVQIGVQASDWEDAIRKSAQTLLNSGAIERNYVEAMVQSLKDNGPYIIVSKHVALAHTRPECGVNHPGLAFATLHPAVAFGSGEFDPIRLVITLAALDAESHMELLGELVDILMEEDRMEALFSAPTPDAFCAELAKEY